MCLIGNFNNPKNQKEDYKTSFQLKFSKNIPKSFEVTTCFKIKEKWWIIRVFIYLEGHEKKSCVILESNSLSHPLDQELPSCHEHGSLVLDTCPYSLAWVIGSWHVSLFLTRVLTLYSYSLGVRISKSQTYFFTKKKNK